MRRHRPFVGALLFAIAFLSGGCGWWGFWRSTPVPSRPSSEVGGGAQADTPPAEGDRPTALSSAPADPGDAIDRVAAVVNQDVITLSELQERVVEHLRQTKGDPAPGEDRALQEKLLQGLVEYRLKLQEAAREKIVVEDVEVTEQLEEMMKRAKATTPEEFEAMVKAQGVTVDDVKKRLREQLMVQKVTRRKVVLRVSVTEGEVEQYLSDNRDKLETGLSFRASHILLAPNSGSGDAGWELARARAEEVWAKLRAGEDFAELAKRYSQDSTANDGGDLGVLKRGELAPEIEEPILQLKPGETSGPTKTSLGYHLFKLESRENLTGNSLTQAKEQIRDILFRQKYQARSETWVQELKRRAIIEIRP